MFPFVLFYRGQQRIVHGRDRMHAKVIAYAAIWPGSKWGEIR
jgi:hypothetical protein